METGFGHMAENPMFIPKFYLTLHCGPKNTPVTIN